MSFLCYKKTTTKHQSKMLKHVQATVCTIHQSTAH